MLGVHALKLVGVTMQVTDRQRDSARTIVRKYDNKFLEDWKRALIQKRDASMSNLISDYNQLHTEMYLKVIEEELKERQSN
jgi:hypothetical protein